VFTGWAFTINASNLYQRGPYLILHTLSCYALLLYTCLFVVKNRKRIDERYYAALLLYGLIPAAAGALQGFTTELSLTWPSMSISVLLIYLDIQDKRLDTDYLTGAYNRRLLDSFMKERAQAGTPKKAFSAILIDLDHFKKINDTLGHRAGDDALTDAVGLLKGCLRHGDFISRYGGDEFLIILDIASKEVLEDTVSRLRESFRQFNDMHLRPYSLGFSTGYGVYDMSSGMDPDQFIRYVDGLMYEDKNRAGIGLQDAGKSP
jgi:diguanylate cyclase (GGDEF)-like protein